MGIKSEDEYVSKMMNYYSIAGAINNAANSNMEWVDGGVVKQEGWSHKIGYSNTEQVSGKILKSLGVENERKVVVGAKGKFGKGVGGKVGKPIIVDCDDESTVSFLGVNFGRSLIGSCLRIVLLKRRGLRCTAQRCLRNSCSLIALLRRRELRSTGHR